MRCGSANVGRWHLVSCPVRRFACDESPWGSAACKTMAGQARQARYRKYMRTRITPHFHSAAYYYVCVLRWVVCVCGVCSACACLRVCVHQFDVDVDTPTLATPPSTTISGGGHGPRHVPEIKVSGGLLVALALDRRAAARSIGRSDGSWHGAQVPPPYLLGIFGLVFIWSRPLLRQVLHGRREIDGRALHAGSGRTAAAHKLFAVHGRLRCCCR